MTSMERKIDSADGVSKIRRISQRITKKLRGSYEVNKNSKISYEEAIWQEKEKSTKIASRRQYVVGSQEYSFKSTLKEVEPEKIQTF